MYPFLAAAVIIVVYALNLIVLRLVLQVMFARAEPLWCTRILELWPSNWKPFLWEWPSRYPWGVPFAIAASPLGLPALWIWITVAKIPWLAILPAWVQLAGPPIILLTIAIECRGLIPRLPHLIRLILLGASYGCFFAFIWPIPLGGISPRVSIHAPKWMWSSLVSGEYYWSAALVSPRALYR